MAQAIMNKALKDCPFCGGEAKVLSKTSLDEREGYNYKAKVGCSVCGIGYTARTKEDRNGWIAKGESSDTAAARATKLWNKRK